jgi:response regulator RpfG family c-di-GMP phosphodiesterase
MVSDRAYGAAMSTKSAVGELLRGSGTQFDPRVVEVFCALVGEAGATAEPAFAGEASSGVR